MSPLFQMTAIAAAQAGKGVLQEISCQIPIYLAHTVSYPGRYGECFVVEIDERWGHSFKDYLRAINPSSCLT